MSDYTPTTEEVYRAHWRGTPMRSEDGLWEHVALDRWLAEVIREAKNDAWFEGFSAGWDECDDPDAFVNDKWDAKTPNPYRQGETE